MPPTPDRDGPWWDARRHADRRGLLLARNRIQAAARGWFATEGLTEVDPAILSVSPGNEAHLHAFATTRIDETGAAAQRYLHTSPEFAMKKLIAAGETAIFAFAHVFRNREAGPRHAGEFTMLEWYRVGASYDQLMADTAALVALAAREAGASVLRHGALTCDPFAPPERISVAEALATHAGVDLLATLHPDGTADRSAMARAASGAGLRVAEDDDWSDLFSRLLVAFVEPKLGIDRLTILDRYPAVEAALARRAPDDPRLAERFEVYACGVELANGFGELTDAQEQRRRFDAEMEVKARVYGERYPLDEDLLAALRHMPPTAGIALGFDRLVMLATGAPRLADVLWTPPL